MSKRLIAGGAAAAVLVVAVLVLGREAERAAVAPSGPAPPAEAEEAPGLLYGRVVTYGGGVYEGRLRWGGGEEAFWSDTFNGVKDENPWAAHVPPERLAGAERPATFLGFRLPWGGAEADLERPFMVRFGDIERIEARGDGVRGVVEDGAEFDPEVRVTLKSGAVFRLDRLEASDFDDGVRVWDRQRGVVDLSPRRIRLIEFLPTARVRGAPDRLHGTVRTRRGEAFTGALQWNRESAVGSDGLVGQTAGGDALRLPFGDIRSIQRREGGLRVALRDGREVHVTGASADRGVYVDDPRYGRVLVSWSALDRVDFGPPHGGRGSGPAYGDFAAGRPLVGTVVTRDGRRTGGRLVYDLDESETTETLDAPAGGVDYSVPFGQIAAVEVPETGRVRVVLQGGEVVELERAGDLGEGNGGLLVFPDGGDRPEYLPWDEVERLDFDHPESEGA